MAELPKIDSEGLRLAKEESAKRVSSVAKVSRSKPWIPDTEEEAAEASDIERTGGRSYR